MIMNSGKQKAESGINAMASHGARSPFILQHSSFSIPHSRPHSAFRFPLSAFPRGLTLIELLVTIVIMVTVLAGALPLLSPNNNSRKLREASRQLNSLFAQAQAQAARDGRPVGVAFREAGNGNPNYSGMALEAFLISVPSPYSGFSENSQVRFRLQNGVVQEVQFVLAGQMIADPNIDPDNCYPVEDVPPRLLKYGDTISAVGATFVLMDQDQDGDGNPDIEPNGVFKPGEVYTQSRPRFQCRYIADLPRDPNIPLPPPTGAGPLLLTAAVPASTAPLTGWTTPRAYQVFRQPVNSSDTPLQFPRGIGIDLESSGAEGLNAPANFDSGVQDVIGVMFNPTGQIDALYMNGVQAEAVDQVYFLMGLFENGNNGPGFSDGYDFVGFPVADAAELTTRRGQINWLNADSRWVSINRAGRIITAENNISFDPTTSPFIDDPDTDVQRQKQISAARQNAKNMNASTGR